MAPGVLGIALGVASVKNIFGGDVDQGCVFPDGHASQNARTVGIDGLAEGLVGLGTVHVGVGGAVDDGADRFFVDHPRHRVRVQDVEPQHAVFRPDVGENEFRPVCRKQPQLRSELPEGPCDQYFLHRIILFLQI